MALKRVIEEKNEKVLTSPLCLHISLKISTLSFSQTFHSLPESFDF